jgi:sugar phosphate isomerase/epimerase
VARVALQLYTIRGECDRDFAAAIGRLGAMGYDGVELFGLHGHTAEEVRSSLDAAGLTVAGRHAPLAMFETELPALAAELAALGTDRAAQSWADPEEIRAPEALLARMESAARAARAAGIRFGFHNHWTEVEAIDDGPTFLDRLRGLPHDLVWLELDLGWIWHGGGDPLSELAATSGRCPLVHLKDYVSRDGRDDVPVGDGVVGYDRIVPAALEAGVEWLVVEEDEVGPHPFDAVERSLLAVRRFMEGA